MRIDVNIRIHYDKATITEEEAERRVRELFERTLYDNSGILTDGGAVIDGCSTQVDVIP